ncbi:LOW QUALITY PROTEIN: uncharacterized protein LOC143287759 [Babylonia areolata]|uniref:LOW QUALITY PROTEIN: uncharacterized protein LOC143287759 n=1 Tax=Babylonia areolata TaxID=304850 RepID=UPI003FD4814B
MTFQVKFGSQPNLQEDGGSTAGRGQRGKSGRGRGQGGRRRGGRPRRDGEKQFPEDVDCSDDGNGSEDDSDGGSSVTSEGQGKQLGRGGRYQGRGRGRGGRYSQRGDNGGEQRRASCNDLRVLSGEKTPGPAQQEIHIYYHSVPPAGGVVPPSQFSQPGYLPYSQQPGPLLSSDASSNPMQFLQQQPIPSLMQPNQQGYHQKDCRQQDSCQQGYRQQGYHQQGFRQQDYRQQDYRQQDNRQQKPYREQHPGQPAFNQPGPPAFSQPENRTYLLGNPPPFPQQGNQNRGGQSVGQRGPRGPSVERQHQPPLKRSAGPTRGSSQGLNQKFSGQGNDRDVRPKQREEDRKDRPPQRPSTADRDTDKPSTSAKNKQEQQPSNSDDKVGIPEISLDESIKIFNFLLRQFNGRTKFGTLFSQKGDLFKGISHSQAAAWLKQSRRFLTFEENDLVKFVSVLSKEARLCYKYRKPNTDKCGNEDCQFLHICRNFVSGCCQRQSACHFNHSFLTQSNAKVCAKAGLQDYSEEDIRTIVLRSLPVVCDKFNKGKCKDDCTDLHVCAQFIMKNCFDENCKLGHKIKGTEHNDWVIETFNMQRINEQVLWKMVITMKQESMQDGTKAPPVSASGLASKRQGPPNSQKHQDNRNKACTIKNKIQISSKRQGPPYSKKRQDKLKQSLKSQEQQAHGPFVLKGLKAPATVEGREEQAMLPASHYTHLCEHHTWTYTCSKGYMCPRFHHPNNAPFVWQLHAVGGWLDFSDQDSTDIEQDFCNLREEVKCEVILETLGAVNLSVNFNTMKAHVIASSVSQLDPGHILRVRRWSTPSYVECEAGSLFNYYTQWVWYECRDEGRYEPLIPGTLQYTLEEKYQRGQKKYYFEIGKERFLLHLQEMKLEVLDEDICVPVLRRPNFSVQDRGSTAPEMSPLLLTEAPAPHWSNLPSHWSSIDCYQEFELVELETSSPEYLDVDRVFHSTLSKDGSTIHHIFRVQNPSLWDKYCSEKRRMTPRGAFAKDVDERKLFHGTPSLLAARGICANNIDFRLAGENVGAKFGRGAYFSANAVYSHSYTQGQARYMFLARVLVGEYTLGDPSYKRPPVREGLKLYDSCVDNVENPNIFVIFDVAQSYPEYFIQYSNARIAEPGEQAQSAETPRAGLSVSGVYGSDARRPVPRPRSSVPTVSSPSKEEPTEENVSVQQLRKRFEMIRSTALGSDTSSFAEGDAGMQRYQSPGASGLAGASKQHQMEQDLDQFIKKQFSADGKQKSSEKCLIS